VVKLSSWPEIGSDGDVLFCVPKGITGYDDDDEKAACREFYKFHAIYFTHLNCKINRIIL